MSTSTVACIAVVLSCCALVGSLRLVRYFEARRRQQASQWREANLKRVIARYGQQANASPEENR
jgi:hypothetical protein